MGTFPDSVISALSDDLQSAVGESYDSLKAYPAIPPGADHRLASAVSLAKAFTKKFLPSDTSEQDAACLSKFLSVNSAAGAWSLQLNTSLDEELWGSFKQEVYNFFYPEGLPLVDSLDSIFFNGRCGPGASIGAINGDFYSKMFSSVLTCTSQGLVNHYKATINRFPSWFSGELARASHYGAPVIVEGSRLSFVPKNDTISRSICTEPSLNMYYQLGLGAILTERLRRYFRIDLADQPNVNAELARLGSLDGSWSTIDLESASDSVSMALLKEVLPPAVLPYFTLLRSRKTKWRGSAIDLHMVSSMGNGFTFPLQTLLFAAMVRAVYASFSHRERVNVFGDDIVIRDYAYPRMLRLLALSGFSVNRTKSFNEGPFRESCGHDYYAGNDIRGVYVKRFSSLQDSYSLINALNWFSAKTGLEIPRLVTKVYGQIDQSMEIPLWEDPSGGIRMPLSMVKTRRRNETTCGTEYSVFRFKARKARIREPQFRVNGRVAHYNPDGLLVAFVSGVALSSGLPLREEGRWKRKRLSCSFWDSLGSSPTLSGIDLRRLETAIAFNLGRD